MPSYDYLCKKCGKKFTLVMRLHEHGKKKVACIKCSSRSVVRGVTPFFASTSRKS